MMIQEHILDFFDDYPTMLDEFQSYAEQFGPYQAGKKMVEYGVFLVYYDEQRQFLTELYNTPEANQKKYSDQVVFDRYAGLISMEVANILANPQGGGKNYIARGQVVASYNIQAEVDREMSRLPQYPMTRQGLKSSVMWDGNVGMVRDRCIELFHQGLNPSAVLDRLEGDFGPDDYSGLVDEVFSTLNTVSSGYTGLFSEEKCRILSSDDRRPDIMGARSIVAEFYKDLVNNNQDLLYRLDESVPEDEGWYRLKFRIIPKVSRNTTAIKFEQKTYRVRKISNGVWDIEEA